MNWVIYITIETLCYEIVNKIVLAQMYKCGLFYCDNSQHINKG